ncbi:UDP-N-acetylmuramoyl-L-alanyl-D-glutamate--2,6-diaminopimelate ligase [Candidatus Latescibacterota bacterium]
MKLKNLIQNIDNVTITGDPEVEITSIQHDSRKVGNGSLFVAVKGYRFDGDTYIPKAVENGAAAVMTGESRNGIGVPVVHVQDIRKSMALIADRFYSSPQEALVMAGITGTNGKTTTSYMVRSIIETGGLGCGLIGTIRHLVGNREILAVNTTPEASDIHASLADMVIAGQSACVMEVSSHALFLSRVHGIRFRAVALTNITRDHLDFHGTFEEYLAAKSILFSGLSGDSTAVVNSDDPSSGHIIDVARDGKILTYGFDSLSDIRPLKYDLTPSGSTFEFTTPSGTFGGTLPIPGRFNISNAMAATGIGIACGFPLDVIAHGLETLDPVSGRYELVDEGQDFAVIVDYAHTPDALERILSSVRELTTGRLLSVFGCGGDRDNGKRPMMGEASARIADISVVTSDNPRSEEPTAIINDIVKGIPSGTSYEVIPDREEAIARAIKLAESGDAIVIAGKGHEDYQIINGKKYHFDDAEIARKYLGNAT